MLCFPQFLGSIICERGWGIVLNGQLLCRPRETPIDLLAPGSARPAGLAIPHRLLSMHSSLASSSGHHQLQYVGGRRLAVRGGYLRFRCRRPTSHSMGGVFGSEFPNAHSGCLVGRRRARKAEGSQRQAG